MNKSEATVRLNIVLELSQKWHRHNNMLDPEGLVDDKFTLGMMRAYAESIRLALGSNQSVTVIEAHLEAGRL